jgi:hypothetical protein
MGTPALMLPLKGPQTQLYRSKCVSVHMDQQTSMVTITAYDGEDVDAGCAITGIMQSTDALIATGMPFSTKWDLRQCPPPTMSDTMRLATWGLSNKVALERLTTRMGVILPNGPVASIAGGLMASFSGVPTVVSTNAEEVHRFM